MNKNLLTTNQTDSDNKEQTYFFKSRRHFKSQNINDRETPNNKMRQRRRSSVIKVFQDEDTIKQFKEIETYLVAKRDEGKFWENFLININ
jgi:hypothetical protein